MRSTVGITFIILAMLCVFGYAVWDKWWYPKTYEYALNLADDASLPAVKANYLQEYLNTIDNITGPPRYVFKRPDLNLEKQKEILKGLITRFRDVAKLDPGEMAYQQGMFQLTGQEIDHQLERLSGIFKSAKLRETGAMFTLFFVVPLLLFIAGWFLILTDPY